MAPVYQVMQMSMLYAPCMLTGFLSWCGGYSGRFAMTALFIRAVSNALSIKKFSTRFTDRLQAVWLGSVLCVMQDGFNFFAV